MSISGVFFHGTRCIDANSIIAEGLKESDHGRLGKGVYVTTKAEAYKVAHYRGHGKTLCVIEIEVDMGRVKKLHGTGEDPNGTWSRHQ